MAWSSVMSQIKVEGGTEAQKRSFYTALYRSYERMVDITEDASYYSGFDKKIHKDTRPFYVDDWAWDTYLAHHPLRTILNPSMEEDMLHSYVRMYEQSGWMPTFPLLYGDHACMNGFHSSITFLDAYRKGLKNFDIEKAYQGMRKNATEATMLPWRNGEKTVLDDFYHQKGYFPSLAKDEKETVSEVHNFEKRQAVAVTLGNSYDDWALGQLGKDLNKNDADIFQSRGYNYKNLWNSEKQFSSWLKLCPGNNISGGKRRKSKKQACANYVSQAFRMASLAGKKSKSALGAYIRRICSRSDKPKGIKAGAHKIACLYYYMCKNGWEYHDKGIEAYEKKHQERCHKSLEKKAREMGYELVATKNVA